MLHELLGQLAYRNETFAENALSVDQCGAIIDAVNAGVITGGSGSCGSRADANPASHPSRHIWQDHTEAHPSDENDSSCPATYRRAVPPHRGLDICGSALRRCHQKVP